MLIWQLTFVAFIFLDMNSGLQTYLINETIKIVGQVVHPCLEIMFQKNIFLKTSAFTEYFFLFNWWTCFSLIFSLLFLFFSYFKSYISIAMWRCALAKWSNYKIKSVQREAIVKWRHFSSSSTLFSFYLVRIQII